MKDTKLNRIIYKYAFAKEIVFDKWFIGVYFNLRNPIIGLSFGFSSFEMNILSLNILIAKRLD